MTDKCKKAVDNDKVLGALLVDLSKHLIVYCHDLLARKLNAYGLYFRALKMIQDYVTTKGLELTTSLFVNKYSNI